MTVSLYQILHCSHPCRLFCVCCQTFVLREGDVFSSTFILPWLLRNIYLLILMNTVILGNEQDVSGPIRKAKLIFQNGKYYGPSNQAKGTLALEWRGAEDLLLCSKRGSWKWNLVHYRKANLHGGKGFSPWHQQSLLCTIYCILEISWNPLMPPVMLQYQLPLSYSFSACRVNH